MKTATLKRNASKGKSYVCKTISGPADLFEWADKIVAADPELDFSKYVRGLIRMDLERVAAEKENRRRRLR